MSNNQFDLDVQVSKNVGKIEPQMSSWSYCTPGCATGSTCNSSDCATVPCQTTTARCF